VADELLHMPKYIKLTTTETQLIGIIFVSLSTRAEIKGYSLPTYWFKYIGYLTLYLSFYFFMIATIIIQQMSIFIRNLNLQIFNLEGVWFWVFVLPRFKWQRQKHSIKLLLTWFQICTKWMFQELYQNNIE